MNAAHTRGGGAMHIYVHTPIKFLWNLQRVATVTAPQ